MSSSPSVNKDMQPKPPNEANNSFVKSVTSRMSGLLPTTITKWFSSPSSSKSNGSAPIAESTDSSTEDEALESPITTQPPAKRMRYNSPGKPHNYTAPETRCTSTNTESVETYSEIQSPISRTTFRSETNFVSTPLHSSSEDSKSSANKKYAPIYNLESTSTNENNSVIKKRKSLFNLNHEEKHASNTTEDSSLPRFKPIQFASPFYNTRTQYSGSSSYYINQPNIKQRKNALVTKSSNNDNNAISQSTKRVLDLLENYSSPLIEARRISQLLKNSTNDSLSIATLEDSSVNNNKRLSYKTQELHVPSFATILRIKQRSRLMNTTSAVRQLIASHSSSSDFKSYPQPESQSSKPEEKVEKLTTKIKSRLTRINREEKDHQEINEPINLPTAVLQIDKDNLPKFSLGIPLSKTPSNPLTTTSTVTTSSETSINTSPAAIPTLVINNKSDTKPKENTINEPEKAYSNSCYQFASPVTVSNETVTASSVIPKFTFGNPESNIVKSTKPSIDDASSDDHNQVVPEKTESTTQPENWKCGDCWVFNNRDAKTCVCCAGKKPAKDKINPDKCISCNIILSQGCIDKCAECQKKNNKIITKPISTDKTQWKCQDCWVMNDDGVGKCVCCGSKKPGPTSSAASAKPKDNTEGDWKCEICWIKNKSNAVKCAACDTTKPKVSKSVSSKINSNTSQTKNTTNDSLFKNVIKSQSDKWECSNCLVRNENNVSKCVCCDTSKPGAITESEKKSFNFGVLPNTTFKFGIDPKKNDAEMLPKSTQMTLVTPAMELETNNNNLTTSFTFGLPKKNQNDCSNKEEEKADGISISKPAFTFGIPKQAPTELTTKSDFNVSVEGVTKMQDETPNVLTNKDEEVEVMKIKQPIQLLGGSQTVNLFSTAEPSENKDNPFKINFPSVKSPNNNLEKSEPLSNANPLMPSSFNSSAETTMPQSTFSFSSSSIKPSLNFFTPQVTTTATSNITFSSSQSPPVSSSLSFFQKTMPASTSSISFFTNNNSIPSTLSLFSKSETTVTTAAPQPVSNTPLFNFGSNNIQNNMTQPEKPKFSFTFGSNNKPETPSLFKTPFASATDTMGVNNFSMNNSNAMNTGNMLSENSLGGMPGTNMSGNILSGGNILPTGNPLGGMSTGNGLEVGNPLGGNVLSSNTMSAGNNLVQPNNSSGMPSTGLFGSIKKENLWSSTNNTSNNMFVTNVMDNNNVQKPPAFSFGSPVPFNSNNTNSTLVFGSPSQPTQNVFGMSRANSQPSLFSNQMQNQAPQSMFGTPQSTITNNPTPSVGLFGAPNMGITPSFGSPNPVPTFEASMNTTPAPAPVPAFNFGAQQPTGIFGFGQQQQQQQQQQQPQQQQVHPGGVYNFGATPTGMAPPQVQFSMGTVPNIPGRRVRKAIRRTTQR